MFFSNPFKESLPTADQAIPGRQESMHVSDRHAVLGSSLTEPYPEGSEKIIFGLGCFWGAERKFWELDGVITTAVGYSAGITANPSYEEVCSGRTGHNEVVLVVFDPKKISVEALFKTFWESHNPTQGMRQGNDRGTQYRSGIYCYTDEQLLIAKKSLAKYQKAIGESITTELKKATVFYFAEDYHQQYLHKNPNGYCGLGGLGVCYPK